MWVVDSHLDEAIELGKEWGFKFKTIAFVWAKESKRPNKHQFGLFPPDPREYRISMGYWTRKQAEVCLLFTKGKPKRLSKGVRQIITAERREHSRKPDEFFDRVEALVGGPYIELFSREARKGWSAFGNQLEKF